MTVLLKPDAGPVMPIGVQLFTFYELLQTEAEKTLAKLADMDVQTVEGFDLACLQQIKPMLDHYAIKANSSFFLWSHLTERWDLFESLAWPWPPAVRGMQQQIALATELDLQYLVQGYLLPDERRTLDDYKRLADALNYWGQQCHNNGIQLCYHHHVFEFKALEGVQPFSYLLANTDPELLCFEFDMFWLTLAGLDVVALIHAYKQRLKLLHLKDLDKRFLAQHHALSLDDFDESTVPITAFKALGQGCLDIHAILQAAAEAKVAHCYIEQDKSSDPLGDIAKSLSFLAAI